MTALAPHLSAFLRDHLPRERNVSPHTVTAYATCFALLVRFAADRLKRRPSDLTIEDFDPDLISAFLEHVEGERGNSARTRNGRLAAIRAFFRYVEYRVPACLDLALRVRSVPSKRTDSTLIDYLTRDEIIALLDAPDPRSRLGTRDRAMLHLAYAGGLRVAELLSLQLQDFPERSLATVHIMGKGRRERVLPLWRRPGSNRPSRENASRLTCFGIPARCIRSPRPATSGKWRSGSATPASRAPKPISAPIPRRSCRSWRPMVRPGSSQAGSSPPRIPWSQCSTTFGSERSPDGFAPSAPIDP